MTAPQRRLRPRPSSAAAAADASDDFSSSSSISIPFEHIAHSRRLLQTSYRRFFFFHVLSLLPTFAILVATLFGSLQSRELCQLQDSTTISPSAAVVGIIPLHSVYQKGQCRRILDGQLLASTLALGLVAWLASYTSRKACLAFADRLIPRLFSSSMSLFSRSPRFQLPSNENGGTGRDGVIVTVAIAMQALIAESLRVLSFYWACCILVTALYLYPIQERYSHRPHAADQPMTSITSTATTTMTMTGPDWAWRLSFRDPRFFVAAWSSMAWALAEFGFGAFQILHQVALYKPAEMGDDGHGDDDDDDDLPPSASARDQARPSAGQSGFSLLSSHPEQASTPERHGKPRRLSASRALETARQRLIQPSTTAGVESPLRSYGTMEEAITESEEDEDEDRPERNSHVSGSSISSSAPSSGTSISLLDQELEEEVERFLVAKERSEVEAVLGVPLPEIPVALCALWRLDAMLWSVGSSLLLSASFTHAQGALGHLSHDRFDLSPHFHLLPPFEGFGLTFAILVVLHTIVSSLWATSLPYLGFATTTYASLLFGLAIMVAALARWGLLI